MLSLQLIVIGIIQPEPAQSGLAPGVAAHLIGFRDGCCSSLLIGAHTAVVGAGALADIDAVGCDGNGHFLQSSLGKLCDDTFRVCPLGVEDLTAFHSGIQLFHLYTGFGVPALQGVDEGVALLVYAGGESAEADGNTALLSGVKAVYGIAGITAVAIQENIPKMIGIACGGGIVGFIFAVYVHVGFTHTAVQQNVFAAGSAIQTDAVNKFTDCATLPHSGVKIAGGLAHPAFTAVVGKADQGIKFMLF